jgi:AI-2 transport protein TqsA
MIDIGERKPSALPPAATALIISAAAWYLLRELTPLLRPLLLAIFLCYVILPGYHGLRKKFPGHLAVMMLAGGTMLVLYLIVLVLQDNVLALREDLPRLTNRAKAIIVSGREFVNETFPWMAPSAEEMTRADEMRVATLRDSLTPWLNFGANLLVEAGLVAVYVLFLLLDASRWPNRLRTAFHRDQGENVMGVVSKINDSIVSYFRVQVIASLGLGVGVTLIMWGTGTSFPVLWGLLNFFGNFVPYLGSIVGYTVPVVFCFLDHELGWPPVIAAILMMILHLGLAYFVVPTMTGKAVGLSPLVVLISLSFWGLCWGVPGMVLAVPLTVIVKIILFNIPFTQPLAVMLADE